MAYRDDEDLKFLKEVSSEDLDILVNILIKDEKGNNRISEELTIKYEYINHSPNHNKYWDLIGAEIQCYGANTLSTMLRGGKGVLYKEVLTNACDKMKVNYNKNSSVEIIEMNLLMKILTEAMDKMSPEELKEVVENLDLKTTNYSAQAVTLALQVAVKFSGFTAYKVAVIVANAIAKELLGRGLTIVANATLTRTIGIFVGPIGWVITGLWTVIDIAGPAYRVTIPTVIQVAFLRAQLKYKDN